MSFEEDLPGSLPLAPLPTIITRPRPGPGIGDEGASTGRHKQIGRGTSLGRFAYKPKKWRKMAGPLAGAEEVPEEEDAAAAKKKKMYYIGAGVAGVVVVAAVVIYMARK